MPQPRQTAAYPTSGERNVLCTLQYATPTEDEMGGLGEPVWTLFGSWRVKLSTEAQVIDETKAVINYALEGVFRRDLLDYFTAGTGIRILANNMTLKVLELENPQARNRTIVAHCANAVNTR